MRVRSLQGDTIDALCHRHLGTTTGMVERVMALNYGNQPAWPCPAHGHRGELPDVPTPSNGAVMRPLVQLWD
ncbi:tail protein [Stenotrophomonas phage Smp131]|uniref:Tail protein n=1 Tax=Stenotrophomonas phage Smp131 TaxID=1168563 RepID=V9IQL8_9CAUD|nr:baseplate hub [Stenotrophomonas phage Smp131]AFJ75482.1 tail protein [Stenotrophomonas phage Smp131]